MHMFFTGAGLMLRSFFIGLECNLIQIPIRTYNINIKCGFDPRCRQYTTP